MTVVEETQCCGRCRYDKPVSAFSPSKRGVLGQFCKACTSVCNRSYRLGLKPPKPARASVPTCRWCGTSLDDRRPDAAYCSPRHEQLARDARRRESNAAKPHPCPNCLRCGADISDTPRQTRYCSKACQSATWKENNPDKVRLLHTRKTYGFRDGDEAAILAAQGGLCPICLQPPHLPTVDHDHITGAVRGVLCRHHNSGMGLLGDDPENLRRAADYLERGGIATQTLSERRVVSFLP